MVKINTHYWGLIGNSNSKLHFHVITTNIKRKGRFLVNNMIWNLFQKTGNVETYLLLKELENEYQYEEQLTMTEAKT